MTNQILENTLLKKAASTQEALKASAVSIEIEKIPVEGYELVIKITDRRAYLTAFIAIHNTALGPSLGGVRIQPYASLGEALEDVLRLAKGMTYKSALSEVGFGGSKGVIVLDPKRGKTQEQLLAFGAAVESLGGNYICAEDAGCSLEDMKIVRHATKYVVGLPNEKSSGDPSPFTAWGVFRGIQSVIKKLFGTDSLEGRTIAVQGLGNVGSHLLSSLFWAGANLIIADKDLAKAERFAHKYGAKLVSTSEILSVECDVLSPCALGGIINDETLPHFHCRAIAGAANNQLLRDAHAHALLERGILYAPDFVINAGGLLNVAEELEERGYRPETPRYRVHHLYDTLLAIYEIAEKNQESTHATAVALANYRIKYGIGKRMIAPAFHHHVE